MGVSRKIENALAKAFVKALNDGVEPGELKEWDREYARRIAKYLRSCGYEVAKIQKEPGRRRGR